MHYIVVHESFAATLDSRHSWQSDVGFRCMPIGGRGCYGYCAVKLFSFRGASERGGRRIAARNDLGDFVEVAGPDEALVGDGAIAEFLRGKFFLLEFRIRGHAGLRVAARKVEHGHVQRVEARQRDELEFVAHFSEFLLEVGDGDVVKLFLPVERRRAIIGQEFPWEFRMNGVGEFPRFGEIRSGGFAPKHVGVRSVSEAASNGGVDPAAELVEAFWRAFAVDEFPVARVRVGKQKSGGVGVGARDENRGNAANVGRKPRRHQFFDELARWYDNFTTQLPALFGRRELVFEMYARSAGFDTLSLHYAHP